MEGMSNQQYERWRAFYEVKAKEAQDASDEQLQAFGG